jgi:hypothetical protein
VAEDGALDEVQSMTRNPAIFEVLWRRFRFVAADRGESPILDLDPGAQILLRRSVNPRELPMQPIFRAASDSRSTTMALAAPVWCTLLRITFVVDYPWSANLGRKAPWQVAVSDGARGIVTARVVALDQARFSTFVDLLPPAETGAIFRGDAPRRRFDRLEISSADRSLFAVQPRFVHLAEVDCVNP